MNTFTLNRIGTLSFRTSSRNQCKVQGHKKYRYTLRLTCPDKLNGDGFIVDHLKLHTYIKGFCKRRRLM